MEVIIALLKLQTIIMMKAFKILIQIEIKILFRKQFFNKNLKFKQINNNNSSSNNNNINNNNNNLCSSNNKHHHHKPLCSYFIIKIA